MEATMTGISGRSHALCAILALGMIAGCAEKATAPPQAAASPPPQVAASPTPELAGAWYQVLFDSSKSDIDDRGHMIINKVAYVVENNVTTRVTVIGRTDRVGNATANLALSQRRAAQVRDALIIAGVPAARIDTRWTGEDKQGVATDDQIAEQRNRVVDITVVKEAR
jgi:peptidoglycan-associated lipoprotein